VIFLGAQAANEKKGRRTKINHRDRSAAEPQSKCLKCAKMPKIKKVFLILLPGCLTKFPEFARK
jgi:hypothetical protein